MADLHIMHEWEESKRANPHIAPPQRDPMFLAHGNISAEEYVLKTLSRPSASALNDALLVLPFASIPTLFTFLNIFASRSMNIPLTCRILFFILKTHHSQIVASRTMRATLDGIRASLRRVLKTKKDEMGYNIAALKVAGLRIQENSVKSYVDENWDDGDDDDGGDARNVRKRAFVHVA